MYYPILLILFSGIPQVISANEYEPKAMLKKGIAIQAKDPIGALAFYRKALFARYPGPKIVNRVKVGYQIAIQSLMEKKKLDKALQLTDEILGLPIKGVESFLTFKMVIAHDKGDYNLSILYANQIVSLSGASDNTHFFKGKSYHGLKAYKLALQSFANISGQFPGKRTVKVLTGDSYYHRGNLERAKAVFREAQALKSSPDVERMLKKIESESGLEKEFRFSDKSPYFILRAHKDRIVKIEETLGYLLDGIYVDLAGSFGFYPETPIQVIIYEPDKRSWSSNLKNPQWSAGVYDGEVRIPGLELERDEYELETLLRHEITHLFLDSMARHSIPTWLNEGIAQYFEKPFVYEGEGAFSVREEAPISARTKELVSQALKSKKIISFEKISGSFNGFERATAELAYGQSLLMARYFMETQGPWKLQRMLREIFMGGPFEAAFQAQCAMSSEEFFLAWGVAQKDKWKLP
ncbi:hypothetical protein HOF92_05245 [bacterium]|jgi:tetratricopeptide (TPR) repeat protein|nr:hypothetical protein [bacterium]